MINQNLLEKYCIEEINKCKEELDHKTHLRYRGRLEAFQEVLLILSKERERGIEK